MALKDKQTEKNKHLVTSVDFAITGIKTAFKDERNFRSHLVSAVLVIVISLFFNLSQIEWLWLLLAIFLVLVMELINTAFENVVDMVTDYHFHPLGKKIKDLAAGAVLMTAIFAIIVGIIIFLPKIYQIILN